MHYVICSSPRSGSTLLAETLLRMGIGKPEEYFNRAIHTGCVIETRKNFMQPTSLVYIQNIKYENTVNGIFGLKTHYSQLARFPEILGNFTHIFSNAKYISVTRRNILRQAISTTRATQTDGWAAQLNQHKRPRFNFFGIIKHTILNANEIELWERFYDAHGITPLRILYEDLDEDYENTIRKVIVFLGVNGDIPPRPIKKQADAITEAWVEHYVRLFRRNDYISRFLRFATKRW